LGPPNNSFEIVSKEEDEPELAFDEKTVETNSNLASISDNILMTESISNHSSISSNFGMVRAIEENKTNNNKQ